MWEIIYFDLIIMVKQSFIKKLLMTIAVVLINR